MTDLTKRQEYLLEIANEIAADVIGFAATLISDKCQEPENVNFRNMTDREIIFFMSAYLDRLEGAYTMQINSIAAKIKGSNDDKYE